MSVLLHQNAPVFWPVQVSW